MPERYCLNCKRIVKTTSGFNWGFFGVLLFLIVIGGSFFTPLLFLLLIAHALYGLYHYFRGQRRCRICRSKRLTDEPPPEDS